ncbi:TPA: S8 family serine peptidase [Streptococcus suis]
MANRSLVNKLLKASSLLALLTGTACVTVPVLADETSALPLVTVESSTENPAEIVSAPVAGQDLDLSSTEEKAADPVGSTESISSSTIIEPSPAESQPVVSDLSTSSSSDARIVERTAEVLSEESNALINVPTVWEAGNKGEGMVIAIVDSGIDVEHDAYRLTDVTKAKYQSEEEFAAVKEQAGIHYGQWYSEKIVFAYNYLDTNNEVKESKEATHGGHVAGIAAGNPSQEDSIGQKIVGVAPEAQLMFMRVFSENFGDGTQPFLYIRAIEDAVKLGADVINLSLGSAAGSLIDASVALNQAIEDAKKRGVSVVIAAGNDRVWGDGQGNPLVENPDYGLVASPAAAKDSIAVASFNNTHVVKDVFTIRGMENQPEFNNGKGTYTQPSGLPDFDASKEYDYVFVGIGNPEDFQGKDLNGKVALIQRGTISFDAKIAEAKKNGAVGAVIFNNIDTGNDLSMAVTSREARSIPSIFIPKALGLELADKSGTGTYKLVFDKKKAMMENPEGNQLSEFTSWGLTADGELKPDVTAPGGAIYSSINDGKYASMNGTSMASPHVAGAVALIKKGLLARYPDLTGQALQDRIKQVLMSTARPHFDTTANAYVSPRQQGSGLIDVPAAIATDLYVLGSEGYPSVSLGNVQDTFSFDVTLYNTSDKAKTVTYKTHLNTDAVADGTFSLTPRELSQVEGQEITVEAHSSKTVTISLDASSYATELTELMPNGYYLEGFVRFLDKDDQMDLVSLPFVGFRGKFQDLTIIEKSIYDFSAEETPFYTENDFSVTGGLAIDEKNFYTTLISGKAEFNHETGEHGVQSPFILGTFEDADGNFLLKKDENGQPILALSPNGDGNRDGIVFRGVFLRNFRNLQATVYAADDTERKTPLWQGDSISGPKNFYAGRATNPRAHLIETSAWEGKDKNGQDLPDGKYQYVITYLPETSGAKEQSIAYTIELNRVRPAITTGVVDMEAMTFKPRAPIAYGMPIYRERVYYVIHTKDENGQPVEIEDPNNIGPTGRPLKEVLTQPRRVYVQPDENGLYQLPTEDILGRPLDISSFFYAVEDQAGNVLSANLSEFAEVPSDHGVVVVQIINDETDQEHPTAYNYIIRDAEGNQLELLKPAGPTSNIQLLPFGTYTVELHLFDKDEVRLINGESLIKTFTVSEENSLVGIDFRVTAVDRSPVLADFGGLVPEGTKIYLINQSGEELELTRARYAPEVFERLITHGEYSVRIEVPTGYGVLDTPTTYTVEEAVRNYLNLTLTAKGDVENGGSSVTNELPVLPVFDLTADTDGDGFTNQVELEQGSDYADATSTPDVTAKGSSVINELPVLPAFDLSADTDGDGFSNQVELEQGSDYADATATPDVTAKGSSVTTALPVLPVFDLSADTDGDGFSNQVELEQGSDYADATSTPDVTVKGEATFHELPVGHLEMTGSSVTVPVLPVLDLTADTDGDGFSNQVELEQGSDYADATSTPDVTAKGEATFHELPVGHLSMTGSSVTAPVLPVFDLTADTDGDGFSNQVELEQGSDYAVATSTPDVTAKGEATFHELPVGHLEMTGSSVTASVLPVFDLTADTDGDGFSNQVELEQGSDYAVATSTPEKHLTLPEVIKLLPAKSAAGAQGLVQQISSANTLPATGVVENMYFYLVASLTSLSAILFFNKREET